MKEKIIKRLNDELYEYRKYIISGSMTTEKLFEEEY